MANRRFLQRLIALSLLVFQPALMIKAFNIPNSSGNTIRNTCLPMGLYEDGIDWDADLFGQIGKSGNKQLASDDDGSQKSKDGSATESDALLDDCNWDIGQQQRSKLSNNVKAMREQMKQSWGVDEKEEGKPSADWMPKYGKGPDEDEPWFTG